MRKKLLNTKLWLITMMLALFSSGNLWADPITIASLINNTTTGWTISGASSSGSGTGLYWMLTSSSYYIETPSITWSDYTNITITIKARTYGGPSASQAKISVSEGSTELTSYTPSSKTLTNSSALSISPSSGKLKIACLGASSSKGSGISEIIIKGELATSAEETSVSIDDSGITSKNVYGGNTTGGSFSATVFDNSDNEIRGASVTWSSSNTSVATINSSTGAVTLVAAGKTTITASYAGVTDVYQASNNSYLLEVINEDPDLVTIWSEDFSTYSKDDVPSGDTYKYSCTNGGSNTQIYEENLAGGTSPELLVGKSSGSFSATIPLLTSTYGYSGDLTLKFKSNAQKINVKSLTSGITVDGEKNEGDGVDFDTKDTHTVTFKGTTVANKNLIIKFTATTANNVRLDDIVLKGKQEELTFVVTPVISPASGAVASGTAVSITCATEGATIYYTTNGTTPTTSSSVYSSTLTINTAQTIKAIAVKDGYTDSDVASASYTIAVPCATPTFSVASGVVDKGTTVTITTATDGATIYYTTNGTTPTTSSSVYSSTLTINTAQTIKAIAAKDGMANSEIASVSYTICDYVSIPVSTDVGKASLPTGFTQSGLGSDYPSSPKLKFDNTGDYLIMKTNEAPGELKFNIVGNSFSGGTFKVQYSADGSSYTDLKSYESLSAKTTETFTNLPATTRYIKWIYTYKSVGNVGLGNINLTGCKTITVSDSKWATMYYEDAALVVPEDIEAITYKLSGSSLTRSTTYESGDKIPEEEPVVVHANAGTYYFPITTTDASPDANNLLRGTTTDNETTTGPDDEGYLFYKLSYNSSDENVGFYWGADNGAAFKISKANRAYLCVPASADIRYFIFEDDEKLTGLLSIEKQCTNQTIYDFQGLRVLQPQKGQLYIVNGKKVLY